MIRPGRSPLRRSASVSTPGSGPIPVCRFHQIPLGSFDEPEQSVVVEGRNPFGDPGGVGGERSQISAEPDEVTDFFGDCCVAQQHASIDGSGSASKKVVVRRIGSTPWPVSPKYPTVFRATFPAERGSCGLRRQCRQVERLRREERVPAHLWKWAPLVLGETQNRYCLTLRERPLPSTTPIRRCGLRTKSVPGGCWLRQ